MEKESRHLEDSSRLSIKSKWVNPLSLGPSKFKAELFQSWKPTSDGRF